MAGNDLAMTLSEAPPSQASTAAYSFHPHDMRIDAEGVHPCAWPVSVGELESLRDKFFTEFFTWIRSRGIDRDRDAELIWLSAWPLGMEILRLFNACAAVQRLGPESVKPTAQAGPASLFQCIAEGRKPDLSVESRGTMRGLSPDSVTRKLGRSVKHAFGERVIRYRPRRLIDPERHIVTFSIQPLIEAHARQVERPVLLSKFDEWMSTGKLEHLTPGDGASAEAVEEILGLLAQGFAEQGVAFPDFLQAYLGELLGLWTARTRLHLDELLRDPKRLPRAFWSGSSGILFNRIMSRAVSLSGGRAVGHDHSSSSGWWRTYLRTVSELNYVDCFVTNSEAMAAGMRRDQLDSYRPREDRPCDVVPIGPSGSTERAAIRQGGGTQDGKRAMVLLNIYSGNSMNLWPAMPDLVAVDWQARLIAQLKERGYAVSIKPHPESHCPPPPAFEQTLGAEIVNAPCEAVMPDADVLIFDYLGASCLLGALQTDRPLVLILFPSIEIDPEARALLGRRVAFVEGRFDEEGRARIDWSDFDAALAAAPGLQDTSFLERYLPPL